MELTDKVVVLTGASRGLGVAISEALVKKKAIVYGLARNQSELEQLGRRLGKNFYPVKMDITDKEAIYKWIDMTFSKNYLPDILINNAGAGIFGKIDEMPPDTWINIVNTNLNGMYYVTSGLIPFLKKNQRITHVLNIGSILATTGREEGTAYCAAKFGVRGFSEALSKELRFNGIKVTCIHPGSIETDFFKSSGIKKHSNMLQPKELADIAVHILETPDNMLIDEIIIRPLNPKRPEYLE